MSISTFPSLNTINVINLANLLFFQVPDTWKMVSIFQDHHFVSFLGRPFTVKPMYMVTPGGEEKNITLIDEWASIVIDTWSVGPWRLTPSH